MAAPQVPGCTGATTGTALLTSGTAIAAIGCVGAGVRRAPLPHREEPLSPQFARSAEIRI